MPRTPEQLKEIRDEKRKLILSVSLKLFANKGFHATSISNIAHEAGIAKGLMYNYFKSKEALVVEIMRFGFLELIGLINPNLDRAPTDEEVKNYIIDIMKSVRERSEYWRMYFAVVSQPIIFKSAFQDLMNVAEPFFVILNKYFESKGYENPEKETRFFTAILDGITLQYVFDPKFYPIEYSIEKIFKMYNLNTQ